VETGVQGTYNWWKELDSGFRRNDGKPHFLIFYEIINYGIHLNPRSAMDSMGQTIDALWKSRYQTSNKRTGFWGLINNEG